MDFGIPPDVTDRFREYLLLQLRRLEMRLGKAESLTGIDRLPLAPAKNSVYFFTAIIPNSSITAVGLYHYDGNVWRKL